MGEFDKFADAGGHTAGAGGCTTLNPELVGFPPHYACKYFGCLVGRFDYLHGTAVGGLLKPMKKGSNRRQYRRQKIMTRH